MNIFRLLCSFAVGLAVFAMSLIGRADEPHDSFRVVAYVPNWIDLDAFSQTIRYDQLTHINIAFENPTSGQGDMSLHSQNEPLIKAAHRYGVKVLELGCFFNVVKAL